MCDLCTAVQVAHEIHELPLPPEQKNSFGYVEQVINNYIQYMTNRNTESFTGRTKDNGEREERNRDRTWILGKKQR